MKKAFVTRNTVRPVLRYRDTLLKKCISLHVGQTIVFCGRSVFCGLSIFCSLSILSALALSSAANLQAASKLNVITSTEDLASLAREVGGDKVTAESIAKGYQDPH